MLLHRQRVVGTAFHRCVVGNDHALDAVHPADAGNDRGGRHIAAVHAVRGELRDLEEGRARIEQAGDTLARQQLRRGEVLLPGRFRATKAILSTVLRRSSTTFSMAAALALNSAERALSWVFSVLRVSSLQGNIHRGDAETQSQRREQPVRFSLRNLCVSAPLQDFFVLNLLQFLDPLFQFHRRGLAIATSTASGVSASCSNPRCSGRMKPSSTARSHSSISGPK